MNKFGNNLEQTKLFFTVWPLRGHKLATLNSQQVCLSAWCTLHLKHVVPEAGKRSSLHGSLGKAASTSRPTKSEQGSAAKLMMDPGLGKLVFAGLSRQRVFHGWSASACPCSCLLAHACHTCLSALTSACPCSCLLAHACHTCLSALIGGLDFWCQLVAYNISDRPFVGRRLDN